MKLLISTLQEARDSLIRTAQAVPEEKLTWRPMGNGGHVLDLLNNATQMTTAIRRLLESRGQFTPSLAYMNELGAERAHWTRERYLHCLQIEGDALLAELGKLTPEELEKPVTVTLLRESTQPMGGWALRAYRTWVSRFGQINYIQTLYGDFEKH